jgi:hypothetical protein
MADAVPLFDAGDRVVSVREPHLVFVLDPVTEETEWHASAPFGPPGQMATLAERNYVVY